MSGIAGLVRLDGAPAAAPEIEMLVGALRRRGPDRQRGWCEGPAALGQALLATTPEARIGVQPWRHPESGCVVVSDSRLDERKALLAQLGIQRGPDDVGDGELLHAAWQRWGEGCPAHLLGDFAFAIWDPRAQVLFCARDPAGVRPFYYHLSPSRLFAFASEAGALLGLPGIPRDIDQGRVVDALVARLEGIDATSSFYRAILRLPAAHSLTLRDGAAALRRYWRPLDERPTGLPSSDGEWCEALHGQLARAVGRRLRADVRVGSMLSGGLDSSSVVALASTDPVTTAAFPVFSAVDTRGPCEETAAIRTMAAAFALECHDTDANALDAALPDLRAHLRDLDEPFDGTMSLVGAQYGAAARAGVRCLLDGLPADNLYSVGHTGTTLVRDGQLRQGWNALLEHARASRLPRPFLSAARSAVLACMPPRVRAWRRDALEARSFRDLLAQTLLDPDAGPARELPARHRTWRAGIERNNAVDPAIPGFSQMEVAYVVAAVERYGRVAARYGVEPRHPFLDRELVEFHAWLPVRLRARSGWPKWALRKAMEKTLPEAIAWRRGKQHLGLAFNLAAFEYVRPTDADIASIPWVDRARFDAAQAAWSGRGDHDAYLALQSAGLVRAWLDATPGDPDSL
jgi:asparagine synthase (glutamine-hydrolysing)